MQAFFLLLWKGLLEFLWGKAKEAAREEVAERQSEKKDQATVDEAIENVRKPLDPTKSVEERQKDAEDAFDRFRDSLK